MTGYYFYILLNFSILSPAIIGIIRRKRLTPSYYPFLLFIWLACFNEMLSLLLIYTTGSNTVNSNIYVLLEYGLLLYQFYEWNNRRLTNLIVFGIVGLFVWIADNMILNTVSGNNSIFRSFYSFIILLYSVDQINSIIFFEKESLLKNPSFIICITFAIRYGFKTFVEAINIFDLSFGRVFFEHLWVTLSVILCLSNLLYSIAILWVPKKQKFILLY